MHGYSSKKLFKVNGGDKLYIYKDGFGDVYSATPEEEREWTTELITESLQVLDQSENAVLLENAIDTLMFHRRHGVDVLLLNKILVATPVQRIAFASGLWRYFRYEKSFAVIHRIYLDNPAQMTDTVFQVLGKFATNKAAVEFVQACIVAADQELAMKARNTMAMWSYADQPVMTYRDYPEDRL